MEFLLQLSNEIKCSLVLSRNAVPSFGIFIRFASSTLFVSVVIYSITCDLEEFGKRWFLSCSPVYPLDKHTITHVVQGSQAKEL